MGFKKKVFGVLAAAALTLSMVGGVAAQTSDSVSGSVLLAAGNCKVNITQANVGFGTWTWNGDQYVHTAGENDVTLNANLKTHKPGGKCSGSVAISGLTNGEGDYITAKHFTGSFTSDWYNRADTNLGVVFGDDSHSGTINFPAIGPGVATATLTLQTVPNDFAPGTYNGTITVTVSQAN